MSRRASKKPKAVTNPGPLIYLITFPNGKHYVGQTMQTFEHRIIGHKSATKKNTSNCRLLQQAIRKYGWDSTKREILVFCDMKDLDEYEQKFIKAYNSLAPNGYNLETGGHDGKIKSDSTKLAMAEAARKRDVSSYRKSEEAKSLPKFMHKVDTKYMKGYRITKHPNCSCKHFCDPNKSFEEKLVEAQAFLDKLNSGEEKVVHQPRQLPIGLQKAMNGFRVFWTSSTGKRYIKSFCYGDFTREEHYQNAIAYLNRLKLVDIKQDLEPVIAKCNEILHLRNKQLDDLSDLESKINDLRTMFND